MITETFPDTDEHGLTRLVSQAGTKRRYSYDAGITWGSTPSKARDAAGIRGRHEIGGICVLMTSTQAKRWNSGTTTDRDLDTISVFVGGDNERELTLRRATSDRLEPGIAECMKDREAVFCNY
jgi:hypothetical protein